MRNNKPKITKQQIIRVVIVLAILALCIIIAMLTIISTKKSEQKQNEEGNDKVKWSTDKELEAKELEELKNMTEKQRMKRYLAKYLSYVEKGEYEKAYELLHDEFKLNYFGTIEAYEGYIDATYTKPILVNYEDIQRQGKYFIIKVNIPLYNIVNKAERIYDEDIDDENMYSGDTENEDMNSEDTNYIENNDSFTQNFVVYEKGYNDFEISFSVI